MINKIKNYSKILGIKYLIYKLYCSIIPIFSFKDTKFRTLFWQRKCVKKLKKYVLNRQNYQIKRINNEIDENNIWVLWLQGEENMPLIVKKCYNSILKYSDNYNVILLDRNNISNYVEIPKFIIEKFENGQMSNAFFSDLIRIELLATYGGIWIDSTVLLTNYIPDSIKESDVFMFQSSKLDYNVIKSSNWFISSKLPNNYIINSIRNVIFTYWNKENYAINSFMFHLIITSLYENDKKFKEEWDKIPYICNMNPHIMWFSFFEKYSDKKWSHILDSCSIHKLSWKFDSNQFSENTLCNFILNSDIFVNESDR